MTAPTPSALADAIDPRVPYSVMKIIEAFGTSEVLDCLHHLGYRTMLEADLIVAADLLRSTAATVEAARMAGRQDVLALVDDLYDRCVKNGTFVDAPAIAALSEVKKKAATLTATAAREEWRPIADAERNPGHEIIGSRWHGGEMTKEPFISFWSPTLGRFYCDPTHYIEHPSAPEKE